MRRRSGSVAALLSLALPLALALALAGATAGCGGDDDDGAGPDGGALPDAAGGPSSLGETCTGAGQGTCRDGFMCLSSAEGSWCTMECTPGSGGHAACAAGYDGPGLAYCVVGVDTNADDVPDAFLCGVVCQDEGAGVCDEATCDGTCPGDLTCDGEVRNQTGTVVALRCQ